MNIVAYGSLMNQASLNTTLQRPTLLTKLVVPGVARIFNAPFGEFNYLNLETDVASSIEAAYFTITQSELTKFAERESGSIVIEIMSGYFVFIWPSKSPRTLPVPRSYIDLCRSGAKDLNINFDRGLIIPRNIFDDQLEPVYT